MNDDEIIISDEQINNLINCNIDMRIIYYKNTNIKNKVEELEHLKKVLKEEKAKEKNYKYWISYIELSISMIEKEVNFYNYLNKDFIKMLHKEKIFLPSELINNIYNYLF